MNGAAPESLGISYISLSKQTPHEKLRKRPSLEHAGRPVIATKQTESVGYCEDPSRRMRFSRRTHLRPRFLLRIHNDTIPRRRRSKQESKRSSDRKPKDDSRQPSEQPVSTRPAPTRNTGSDRSVAQSVMSQQDSLHTVGSRETSKHKRQAPYPTNQECEVRDRTKKSSDRILGSQKSSDRNQGPTPTPTSDRKNQLSNEPSPRKLGQQYATDHKPLSKQVSDRSMRSVSLEAIPPSDQDSGKRQPLCQSSTPRQKESSGVSSRTSQSIQPYGHRQLSPFPTPDQLTMARQPKPREKANEKDINPLELIEITSCSIICTSRVLGRLN